MNRIDTIKQACQNIKAKRSDNDLKKLVDSVLESEYAMTQDEKLEKYSELDFN